MLENENTAVDWYDFTPRKSLPKLVHGLGVLGGLVVGRHEHCTIYYEEVSMGGRKTIALFVITRVRKWQRIKCVGFAIGGAEGKEFLLHSMQSLIVFITGIVTLHVGNGGRRTKACNVIYMAIGIVASQPRMM